MDTQCRFDFVESKDVRLEFDGGRISSDAGLTPLIQWEHREGFIEFVSGALEDPREAHRVEHTLQQLIRQRTLQIAAGYEDASDSDELSRDPMFQAANGKLDFEEQQNASQPTMSRLENRVSAKEVVRLNRLLLEWYVKRNEEEPPDEIVLEIDATHDPTYGSQQLSFFHGFYGGYGYLPLVIFDGTTGELLSMRLRAGDASDKARAQPHLKRVIGRLKEAFPETDIQLRADNGFTDAGLYRRLDELEVAWTLNYASNAVLKRRTEDVLREVQAVYEETGQKTTRYVLLEGYQAGSWEEPRPVVAKVEAGPEGTNRRFVVCSTVPKHPMEAFVFYEGRGVCEQYIKELKDDVFADRLSCSSFVANAFRFLVHGLAYTMINNFRTDALAGTELADAWAKTIRRKLFKLGARIKTTARKLWIHASESWPFKNLFEQVAARVAPA